MASLAEHVARCAYAPYVYSYPSSRTYAPVERFSLAVTDFTHEVNLYVHIPFCEQKCSFCGYLTTVTKSAAFQDEYVDCVVRDIGRHRDVIRASVVKSVNFGGGTPSLLSVDQFAKIMRALNDADPLLFRTADEISIEATPESIVAGKIAGFMRFGLNRVSVGVQSLLDGEIASVNRHNSADQSVRALKILRDIGIRNTCVDLMYGLEGQDADTWKRSVQGIIALAPETVELYSVATVPGTPLALRGGPTVADRERVERYVFAREAFLAAGYSQDCHLRFVKAGGGYRQQHNVFGGQSLIGFGAGARSYARNVHYRNAFDAADHRGSIREYMRSVQAGESPVRSAVMLTDDDRRRQYVIYRLEHLDAQDFAWTFGRKLTDTFPSAFEQLLSLGLMEERGSTYALTPKGFAFRDVIAASFFSEASREVETLYRIRMKA